MDLGVVAPRPFDAAPLQAVAVVAILVAVQVGSTRAHHSLAAAVEVLSTRG